ncbi:MAG: methyltransferase domain-containing protein [Candidatus Saccharibacteria bacterium]|nr:methyltransferase domain-containing protein [Rhodoferax sp.]
MDVIISNHALEHTLNPLEELKALRLILKKGGTIHFFVPCDSISYAYNPEDINYHLYSWRSQNWGNLFHKAGFEVIHAVPHTHKWTQYYRCFAKLGWLISNFVCKIYAHF